MNRLRILISLIVIAACWSNPPSSLRQASGQDFKVSYSNNWPASDYGLRTVRVKIAPFPTLLKEARSFTFVYNNGGGYGAAEKVSSCKVVLEAGAKEAVGELYIPIDANGYGQTSLFLDVDGNLTPNRADLAAWTEFKQHYSVPSTTPKVLVVSSSITLTPISAEYRVDAKGKTYLRPTPPSTYTVSGPFPDLGTAQTIFDEYVSLNPYRQGVIAAGLGGLSSELVCGCSPDAVPLKWQGLSGISHLFISIADLKLMENSHPARKLAIERWVAAGGHLIVFDCGKKFEQLEKVKSIVNPETSRAELAKIRLQIPGSKILGLKKVVVKELHEDNWSNFQNANQSIVVNYDDLSQKNAFDWDEVSLDKAINSKAPFCSFSVARGAVICVRDDGVTWKKTDWLKVFNSSFFLGPGITKTTGYNTAQVWPQYAIRGLGKPPAIAFRLLILFFIILTGPVSYFLLKRAAKLHLLFIFVPLVSSIFCFSLLSYAVLMDGFGIQGRRITVTDLDQIANKRATSMHYTIYSGLAPQPYQFAPTAFGEASLLNRSPRTIIEWGSSSQILRGAEIRPRTSHQVFAFQSTETKIGLAIRERQNADGETEVTVTNRFEDEIVAAVIRTERGHFKIGTTQAGETAIATPLTPAELTAFQRDETRKELGTKLFAPKSTSFRTGNIYSDTRVDGDSERLASTNTDVLELFKGSKTLLRRTYIAYLNEFSESTDPVENIQMESNLNVVFGKW